MGRQTPGFTYIYLPGPATLIVYSSPWTRFGSLRQGWPADNPSECFWLQARVTSRRGTDVAIIRMAGVRHLTFLRCSDIKKPPMCLGGLSVLDSFLARPPAMAPCDHQTMVRHPRDSESRTGSVERTLEFGTEQMRSGARSHTATTVHQLRYGISRY